MWMKTWARSKASPRTVIRNESGGLLSFLAEGTEGRASAEPARKEAELEEPTLLTLR